MRTKSDLAKIAALSLLAQLLTMIDDIDNDDDAAQLIDLYLTAQVKTTVENHLIVFDSNDVAKGIKCMLDNGVAFDIDNAKHYAILGAKLANL